MRILAIVLCVLFCTTPAFGAEKATVYRRGTAENKIALTFDDGPHTEYTEEILSVLSEWGVKATFFVIGENAEAHPELLLKVKEGGHEIGNHTYSHVFLRDLSLAATCKEITRASDAIEKITGERPRLFRPPGGSYSDSKIAVISEMGYVSVLWSKDTRDWTSPSVDSVVSAATESPTSGDIILFHDFVGRNSPTPAALRKIIPEIKNRGFEFVTVSDLLNL